jgi:hypothetical protein
VGCRGETGLVGCVAWIGGVAARVAEICVAGWLGER